MRAGDARMRERLGQVLKNEGRGEPMRATERVMRRFWSRAEVVEPLDPLEPLEQQAVDARIVDLAQWAHARRGS